MSARFTVVYDRDVLQLLDSWTAGDLTISRDRDTFDNDLTFAPHTAGEQKASGYYVGRRGSIDLKYAVSDDDRIVRIIGAQLCSHPFYVELSRTATEWLRSVLGSREGELALAVFNQLLPSLRRDPRLVDYLAQSGRVALSYRVIDVDCRVCVTTIRLTDS